MRRKNYIVLAVVLLGLSLNAFAQQSLSARYALGNEPKPVSLVLRGSFVSPLPEHSTHLTEQHIAQPNVELKLYGPGAKMVPGRPDTGLLLVNDALALPWGESIDFANSSYAHDNWAVLFKEKNHYVDLTNRFAKIRWRIRPRSLHTIRLVIKLADGTMLTADHGYPASSFWYETEFYLADIPRWRVLDETKVAESKDTAWRNQVDLSRVDEIGFTDLMRGGGSGTQGNSAFQWIEVYGNPVERTPSQSQSLPSGRQ